MILDFFFYDVFDKLEHQDLEQMSTDIGIICLFQVVYKIGHNDINLLLMIYDIMIYINF